MSSAGTALEAAAAQLPGIASSGVTLAGGRITVPGHPGMEVPRKAGWLKHDAPTVWPTVPHGEPRPTLLFGIVRDAGTAAGPRPLDSDLRDGLLAQMPGDTSDKREALAAAMIGKFWHQSRDRSYLLPLHATLPMGFSQSKAGGGRTAFGYKMFRGNILPFLCHQPGGVDTALLGRLLAVFENHDDLTRLDGEVLGLARQLSPDLDGPSVQHLMDGSRSALLRLEEAGGAFCQPSNDLFRSDLEQVLGLELPRRDLINQLTHLLALHLATRLYRAALVLSLQIDRLISIGAGVPAGLEGCEAGCAGQLERCQLSGQLLFRCGSGAFRSVTLDEPCVTSYQQMTSRYLMPLPVNITLANLAREALAAAGGPAVRQVDVPAIKDALASGDPTLRDRFEAVMLVLALCRRWESRGQAVPPLQELGRLALGGAPGVHALREALLEARRGTMRHEGRDVVHQLVKEVQAGRLVQSNGTRATFFEIDEDLLYLLVRLVCRDSLLPFTEFLRGLRAYGLRPQDRGEEYRLQSALARLGMLERYSDAPESAYVHHMQAGEYEEQG